MPLTLRYKKEGKWLVGYLEEEPEVISQGETLEELEENIRDAYELILSERKKSLHLHSLRSSKSRQACVLA